MPACPVIGFDIDPRDDANALKESGGEFAISRATLPRRCRTIIVAVFDAEQAEALLAELSAAQAAARPSIICTTTCAPDEIDRLAERAAAPALRFVEAPISGTSAEVRDGIGDGAGCR